MATMREGYCAFDAICIVIAPPKKVSYPINDTTSSDVSSIKSGSGACRLFTHEISIAECPRFRLISGVKLLPPVGALVRDKKASLTGALRPVGAFTGLAFDCLSNESLLASLESPACSGPGIGVHIFRAWAQEEKEKSPTLGEVLPM